MNPRLMIFGVFFIVGLLAFMTMSLNSEEHSGLALAPLRTEISRLELEKQKWQQRESTLMRELETLRARAETAENAVAPIRQATPLAPVDSAVVETSPTAVPEVTGPLSETQKRRLREIRKSLPELVEAKDGQALIAALRELRPLGPEAYPLIIEIANIINQDMHQGGNKLGIKMQEYYISFSPEIHNWALQPENFKAAGPGFRLSAAHAIIWTANPDKDKIVLAAIARETEDWAVKLLAGVLHHRPDPETGLAILDQLKNNPDLAQANRDELTNLLAQMPGEEVDNYLRSQLELESDPDRRDRLQLTLNSRSPQETGYMVRQVFPDTQANSLGLKSGDIIIAYGGYKLNEISLGEAKNLAVGESIPVEIFRNGNYITVQMAPGQLGIDGNAVVRK